MRRKLRSVMELCFSAQAVTRMVKGEVKPPDPRYYTIAGFEFG
ncbi:MAG: hypothetical protein WKF37_17920 [Bryobacteraceae bacterium]